jgi:hypothetical protein
MKTSSHAAALLHVQAYDESPVSDSFCHAVKSNDPYRMRGPYISHTMVTRDWSEGLISWGTSGDDDVASFDVNSVNAKSREAHDGNVDDVLVLHVDEPFWSAYEKELRAEEHKGAEGDGGGDAATTSTSAGAGAGSGTAVETTADTRARADADAASTSDAGDPSAGSVAVAVAVARTDAGAVADSGSVAGGAGEGVGAGMQAKS